MTDWRMPLGPLVTPVLRAWWRFRRPMTLGVRIICRDESGRILLVRHGYARGWHLPGGGVERGETAVAAALRELAEEGGAEATDTPRLIGFFANHANFPNDHVALYAVDAWRPCTPKGGREIVERGWFAPDALPAEVTPGTKRRITELIEGAPASASW